MISQLITALPNHFTLDQNPYRCADFGRMFDTTLFSIAKKKIALGSICQGEVRYDEGGTQMRFSTYQAQSPVNPRPETVTETRNEPRGIAPRSVDQLINTFEAISLKDSAKAALMDRSEAKYVCHIATLLEMLPRLREDYVVLEIEGGRAMGYRSLYLDTPDFGLYMAHHNGKPSRYKVRYRHYLHTDTVFFEVKVREKGKTCKERVLLETDSDWSHNLPNEFLKEQRPHEHRVLEPKLEVWCRRITLVGKHSDERLTIDLNLAYGLPESSLQPGFANLVILELKYSSKTTTFMPIAHQLHLRGQSFSKYSVGCGLLYPTLKANAFKPQRLTIERIEHG
jgi:VTC domain